MKPAPLPNQDEIDQYQNGWNDCADGFPHTDKGEWYNRGYSARYWHDQAQTARSLTNEYMGNTKHH